MMAMAQDIDARAFARSLGTVMTFQPGDTIYREDDSPQCMYVILSGAIEITRHGKPIETISEGNALGVLSLLDGQPRSTTARASTVSELALLDQRKFRYMVEVVPNFVWYVMGELAHRLRTTNAAI